MDFNTIGQAYNEALQNAASQMGISLNMLAALMTLISIWTLVWKGLALWRACQKNQKIIFVILLIINDFGLVELLYYFWLSKIGQKKEKEIIQKGKAKRKK